MELRSDDIDVHEERAKGSRSQKRRQEAKEQETNFQELSNVRDLTKMAISQATFGVRRPMSTTFVDIFKGYNAVVYTKIKFQEEMGQNSNTVQKTEVCRYFHIDPI